MKDREHQMSNTNEEGGSSFLDWTPDFNKWPKSWMGVEEDLSYGSKLMPWFAGFLQELYSKGLSRKTFNQYRDNLWLLGGTIIKSVSHSQDYQKEPITILMQSVADAGILPDHFDEMTGDELLAFERMCRRFEKHLAKVK